METPRELEPLIALLEKDEPRVLVVVGTGVSYGATGSPFARWQGLIESGYQAVQAGLPDLDTIADPQRREAIQLERDDIAAALQAVRVDFRRPTLDLDNVLHSCKRLTAKLGGHDDPRYAAWLASTVGTLTAAPDRDGTLRALRDLHNSGALLLTTNYDHLLSDACGEPPVTWLEPGECLRVMHRERPGILHVHGEWRCPESIVLGKSDYDRIRTAERFEHVFKVLWTEYTWLCIGCGDGLADPHFGPLFEWGYGAYPDAARPIYYLTSDGAPTLPASNFVPLVYGEHERVPELLRSLSPLTRCHPFVRLGPDAACDAIRSSTTPPMDSTLPSWDEYVLGVVPALRFCQKIDERLARQGWAFVLDTASVGKTTAAVTLATRNSTRRQLTFYLSLRNVLETDREKSVRCIQRLHRLCLPGALIIVDDVHHHPVLARELRDEWNDRRNGSQLLLLGTRGPRGALPAGVSALAALQNDPRNPSIEARPKLSDLRDLYAFLMRRLAPGASAPEPPSEVLRQWHRDFGCELAAFATAVTDRRDSLVRGDWTLPISAAADWVRDRHLRGLAPEAMANAATLAAFAAQEIDLEVPRTALPYPEWQHLRPLLGTGIVRETRHAAGTPETYGLHEAGWGELMLSAMSPRPDTVQLLHAAASRSAVLALHTSVRLQNTQQHERHVALWTYLTDAEREMDFRRHVEELPLPLMREWLSRALSFAPAFAATIWADLAGRHDALVASARSLTLVQLEALFATACAQGQRALAESLWRDLSGDEAWRAARLDATPLDEYGVLARIAGHTGDASFAALLWDRLLEDRARFAGRVAELRLRNVNVFVAIAAEQRRPDVVQAAWEALALDLDARTEEARREELWKFAAFAELARRHGGGPVIAALWDRLASDVPAFLARVDALPLRSTGFLLHALRADRRTDLLDDVAHHLAVDLDRLTRHCVESRPTEVSGFLTNVPEALSYTLSARIDVEDLLDFSKRPEPFAPVGLMRLADKLGDLGRPDLRHDVIHALFSRAEPRDFPPRTGGFNDLALLLSCLMDETDGIEHPRLSIFLDRICKPGWMRDAFALDEPGHLAGGLGRLATRQSPAVLRRFVNERLGLRVRRELRRRPHLVDMETEQGLALAGAADYAGLRMEPEWFAGLELEVFGALPARVLPHAGDADTVQFYQRQMWMGLRVMATHAHGTLRVDGAELARTLELWRLDLLESESRLPTPLLRLDRSMVAWLEASVAAGEGRLVPAHEPLWRAAGTAGSALASVHRARAASAHRVQLARRSR